MLGESVQIEKYIGNSNDSRTRKHYFIFVGRDFYSNDDLYIACMILQKQIEHINGDTDKIVTPSIRMRQIREQQSE